MSLPTFPNSNITRDDAINQILSSIAMEELGLSHILNAEGEKLQYVLGTLDGVSGPVPSVEEILAVNDSIQKTLQATMQNQIVLKAKMAGALDAPTMQGPTGPTGPTDGITSQFVAVDDYIMFPEEKKSQLDTIWIIHPSSSF